MKYRRADLVAKVIESVQQHGLRGPDHNSNFTTICPMCVERVGHEDAEWKLTLRAEGQAKDGTSLSPQHAVWSCYRCAFRGYGDLTSILGGFELAPEEKPRSDKIAEALAADLDEAAAGSERITMMNSKSGKVVPYANYLRSRGVYREAVRSGVFAGYTGKYGGRCIFPIREVAGGPWLGFTARSVDPDAKIRYLYPRGMNRERALWGLDIVRDDGGRKDSRIFLVEGVFDALPLEPLSVAAGGKEVTNGQMDLLASLGRPIVVCLDGDAWMYAQAVALQLRLRGAEASWCRLPPGKDPGQLRWSILAYVISGQ